MGAQVSAPIRLLAFDTESSGLDPTQVRLVTAYLGIVDGTGAVILEREWLLNSGVDIPAEAAAVHGVTTERMHAEGRTDFAAALEEIRAIIMAEAAIGTPLAAHNAPYDLTLLDAELRRAGLPALEVNALLVLDSLVIDKGIDKYRKGSRKLVDVAAHYGVPITAEEAHEARADAVAAARIVLALHRSPKFPRNATTQSLQGSQKAWKREQSASLQAYFRSPKAGDKQDLEARVNGGWPTQDPG